MSSRSSWLACSTCPLEALALSRAAWARCWASPACRRVSATWLRMPPPSARARCSSVCVCRARPSARSAMATAPLQLRPPQRGCPSSSRHPAPPQGLVAQGASPGAPHTSSFMPVRLRPRARAESSPSACWLAMCLRLKSSLWAPISTSVRCRVPAEWLTGLGTARADALARRPASADRLWARRMLS